MRIPESLRKECVYCGPCGESWGRVSGILRWFIGSAIARGWTNSLELPPPGGKRAPEEPELGRTLLGERVPHSRSIYWVRCGPSPARWLRYGMASTVEMETAAWRLTTCWSCSPNAAVLQLIQASGKDPLNSSSFGGNRDFPQPTQSQDSPAQSLAPCGSCRFRGAGLALPPQEALEQNQDGHKEQIQP